MCNKENKENKVNKIVKEKNGWLVVQCGNCSPGCYAVPTNGNAATDALHFYDERIYLVGRYISWAHLDFLKRRPPGHTLLDIGTGTGDFVNAAVNAGYDARGIEMDARAVAAGNAHWKFNRLQTADALEFLKQSDETWDIITLFAVLEHIVDPNILFSEVVRHVNPGGHIAIVVQNLDTFYAKLWAAVTPGNDYPPNHYTRWSRKSLDAFIGRYNLSVIDRSTSLPSIMDNAPDIAINVAGEREKLLKWLLRGVGLATIIMSPAEALLRRVSKEGRAQMVIARKR